METHIHLIVGTTIADAPIDQAHKMQSADVHHTIVESFGIDDARTLIEATSRKSVEGEEHVFVLLFSRITVEAQNALLKLFEEPPENTLLYVIIPHESIFIPTLRSRFISVAKSTERSRVDEVRSFLGMSYKERLELIAQKAKEKDTQWMESLTVELEREKQQATDVEAQQALLTTDTYVRLRGASRKMLLEHMALTLPVHTV